MGRLAERLGRYVGAAIGCLLLFLAQAADPPPSLALARRCSVELEGRNVATASTPADAIPVPSHETLNLSVSADRRIEQVRVDILFGPFPVISQDYTPAAGNVWQQPINVSEYATVGAGYYQVVGTIDQCPPVTAWIVVQTDSPLTTLASIGALIVLTVGAGLTGAGVLKAARSGGGRLRAVAGGALVGGSSLVLAQQTGVAPADTTNALTWTLLPGAAGGATQALVGAVVSRSGRGRDRAGAGHYYPPRTYDQPPPAGFPPPYSPPAGGGPPGYGPGPAYPPAYQPPPGYTEPPRHYQPPPGYTEPPPPYQPPPRYAEPPPPYQPPPAYAEPEAAHGAAGGAEPEEAAGAGDHAEFEETVAAPPPPRPMPAAREPLPPTAGTAAPPARRAATRASLPPAPPAPEPRTSPVPEPTAAAVEGPAPEPDPPRESYAHIRCPETVVAEEEFELEVGLASMPDREVVGGPLVRPARSVGSYTITIQVIADGFRLTRPQESWRVDLRVTASAPYPQAVLHLAAESQTRPVVAHTIRAMFSVDGQAIGLAARPIAVVREAELVRLAEPAAAEQPLDISLPTDSTPPDLTVRIDVSQPAGRLLLQLLAADAAVALPSDPLVVDIGNEPEAFLRNVIQKMNAAEGQPGMYQALMGIGLTISEQLPNEFWRVLGDVAARVEGRLPTILFLSAEPYVPWELAVLEEPLDPALPPFLSAQASVGRWVLGQRRPKLPPPSELTFSSIAVVSGVYALPGWERLIDAEQEAQLLAQAYGATPVNAASQSVLSLMNGSPAAEVLHFAVHGQYDPNGEIDGLVLVDGLTLDPMQIRGSRLATRPFVFLNACQVGSGQAVLGDYAGLAEAFLFAGASGVIAPLWSIDDVTAREIALRFYEKALSGKTPAEILREERAAFRPDPAPASSTYLAYQFFGHPHLTLARAAE